MRIGQMKNDGYPLPPPPRLVSTSIQLHNNVRPVIGDRGPDPPLIGGRRIIVIMFSRDFA